MAALDNVAEAELLSKVKSVLGVSGNFHDTALGILITDVKYYLEDAGCSRDAVNGQVAVGCIIRGVADLWNIGSGTVNLSPYFKERAAVLALSYPKGGGNV